MAHSRELNRLALDVMPMARLFMIAIIFVLAFVILDVTRPIAAPILLALVTAMILEPLQTALGKFGIKGFAASTAILLSIAALGLLVMIAVEPLIWRVTEEIPRLRYELKGILTEIRASLQGVEDLNDEIRNAVSPEADTTDTDSVADVATPMPSMIDAALLAPVIIGQVFIFLGTLFFALNCRHDLYASISMQLSSGRQSRGRVRRAESEVARYFGTIALINAGLGVALAVALGALGLPLPVVWGAAAAVLNFIVYLGPGGLAVALLLAGIVHFEGLMVLAPMGTFLVLNAIEAQFVTPTLVGRHMSINPLLIFASIVFWLWFWGPVGGILAIPLLVFGMALLETKAEDAVVERAHA